MSTHIGASPGQIAPRILLPGDPRRATWIADTFLDDASLYSDVRGMLGYSGSYRGKPVSVQGTGMGQPSLSIYVNELIRDYDVQQLVRVGSCGALSEELAIRDVVLAISASTDSAMNKIRFEGLDYAATADFGLLRAAYDAAVAAGTPVTVAKIFSGDAFYSDRPELLQRMVEYGVVAVEMEANALYTLAAKHGRRALCLCTVSDHIVSGAETTAQEREQTFGDMIPVALDAMLATALPS
ncbi:MAG: purine-nucleoside phosphorylase [Propionibacteriales bacterium]|jgi:purine-nucleoside phosphorylase|nr:purine-nucleoside phosphorylase [Propionibacteriales bacterium]